MAGDLRQDALVSVTSAEILVHTLNWFFIVAPLTSILLPGAVIVFAAYEVVQSTSALWLGGKEAQVDVSIAWIGACTALFLLVFMVARSMQEYLRARLDDEERASRMREPNGPSGQLLVDAVHRIWRSASKGNKAAPNVAWYSGFQIAAHAHSSVGLRQIQVSSGLWARIASKDIVGDLILAHEMGHLIHADPRFFRAVSVALHGMRAGIQLCRLFVLLATGTIVCFLGVGEINRGTTWTDIIRIQLTAAAIAALGFVLLTLSDLLVRRYASFIVAMVEIRADVCASIWTIGLQGFAENLENDASLHRSTAVDLGRSIFSADITHVSESERIALIRNTQRLCSPKLRYYFWSVVLALLVPLNPITPLIFGGAIDHALVAVTAATLCAATVAMLVLSAASLSISWPRAVALAAAMCLTVGSTRINFYEIGYLLTSYSVAIANSTGFGAEQFSLAGLLRDTKVSVLGLAGKIGEGMDGWWILATVPITAASLKLIRPAMNRRELKQANAALAIVASIAAFTCALLVGRDPWRSALYDYITPASSAGWINASNSWPQLRLALPAIVGLLAAGLCSNALSHWFTQPGVPAPEQQLSGD